MSEDQVELAQRCLAGDQRALSEFIELFQQQVFAVCMRMLGHRQDAEDATQESLVRAVRYLKSWDATLPLRPWVLKIASNRCRTVLGKRAKSPVLMESVPTESESDINLQLGLAEELSQALKVLQDQPRECFVLFYEQELSIIEISELMEVPLGTVKTWLHRSRKQLAQYLVTRGIQPPPGSKS